MGFFVVRKSFCVLVATASGAVLLACCSGLGACAASNTSGEPQVSFQNFPAEFVSLRPADRIRHRLGPERGPLLDLHQWLLKGASQGNIFLLEDANLVLKEIRRLLGLAGGLDSVRDGLSGHDISRFEDADQPHQSSWELLQEEHELLESVQAMQAQALDGARKTETLEDRQKLEMQRQRRAHLSDEEQVLRLLAGLQSYRMRPWAVAVQFGAAIAVAAFATFSVMQWLRDPPMSGATTIKRSPHLDTAKAMLMPLVVLSHFPGAPDWPRLPGMPAWPHALPLQLQDFQEEYPVLYLGVSRFLLFHVRTYCFISGAVLREPPANLDSFLHTLLRPLCPLICLSILARPVEAVFLQLVDGRGPMCWEDICKVMASNFWEDTGKGWFLQALFLWRLWGLLILPMRSGSRLAASLAVAIAGGYDTGWSSFHAARAASMFPVFVLGQLFPLEGAVQRIGPWSAGKALLGAALLGLLLLLEASSTGAVLVDALPEYEWTGLVLWNSPLKAAFFWLFCLTRNLLEIVKGLVLLLLCCPREESPLAVMGRRSLYPYLLHGPFVWLSMLLLSPVSSGFVSASFASQASVWLAALALSAAVVALLSTAQVVQVFSPFFEPVWLGRLLRGLMPPGSLTAPGGAVK